MSTTDHEPISHSKGNGKQMKMNTFDRYKKTKHYLRQKNAGGNVISYYKWNFHHYVCETKLFHSDSLERVYRETWRP